MSCKIIKAVSLFTAMVGLTTIVGWIFDISVLRSIQSDWVHMRFVTAACFVFSGVTIFFIHKTLHNTSDISIAVLPAASISIFLLILTPLMSRVFNIPIGIEEIFIQEIAQLRQEAYVIQPSLAATLEFVLIALAGLLALLRIKQSHIIFCAIGVFIMTLGLSGVTGYIFKIPYLYFDIRGVSTPTAVHTATTFFLIGFSLYLTGRESLAKTKAAIK